MKINKMFAAVAAAVTLGLVAATVPAPVGAGIPFMPSLTITKIVLGDGPDGPYEFEVTCGGDIGYGFELSSGESFTITAAELQVDFADGVECLVREHVTLGAEDVGASVLTEGGASVASQVALVDDRADVTFSTVEDAVQGYSVVVGNEFPLLRPGDLCALTLEFGVTVLDTLLGFDPLAPVGPAELEALWATLTDYFIEGSLLAPPELRDDWDTVLATVLAIGALLDDYDWDLEGLPDLVLGLIESLDRGLASALAAIVEWLLTNCGLPGPATPIAAPIVPPATVTPRFTG
jgi:hypothetical protein